VIDRAFSLSLVALMLVVSAAYAARVSRVGAAHHSRIDRAGGSPLLGKGPMQMGYWAMRPAASACVAMGIAANTVSWASLVLGACAGLSFALGHFGAGAAFGFVSSVCDALDGMVARETGTASDAGEVLDAAVDRYTELFFLGGLVFSARFDPLGVGLALAATAGSIMVSYATAKAETFRVEVPRGAMRRQERAVYLVLGAALTPLAAGAAVRWALPAWVSHVPLYSALALVAAVGNVSAVHRLHAIARAVRAPCASAREPHGSKELPRDARAAAGDVLP
jgi:CDP-diacylglycerol--glycerol-3-phosphate 3-phosphatidyltransferase